MYILPWCRNCWQSEEIDESELGFLVEESKEEERYSKEEERYSIAKVESGQHTDKKKIVDNKMVSKCYVNNNPLVHFI